MPINYPLEKLPIFFQEMYWLILPILTPILTSRWAFIDPEKINYFHFSFSMLTGVVVLIIGINFYLKKVRNDMEV